MLKQRMSDERVPFLGLIFEPASIEGAVEALAKSASADAPFSYIVTPNVDHMIRLDTEPDLRRLYGGAGRLLNDSRILELLASWSGLALPASPGADIVATLFERAIAADEPVNVIGCTHADIEALRARFGLAHLNWHDAPMGLRRDPEAVEACAGFMAAHPARFHFICVGSPQQEMVALAAKRRGGVTGTGICCGASLEFLSGRTTRAPAWMRAAKLEWLHRMLSDPKRLVKRYLVDGPKIVAIWRRWRR